MPVGFIFGTSVKIYDDVAAVLIASNVKAVFVILAGVGERKQICNAACWETRSNSVPKAFLPLGLTLSKP